MDSALFLICIVPVRMVPSLGIPYLQTAIFNVKLKKMQAIPLSHSALDIKCTRQVLTHKNYILIVVIFTCLWGNHLEFSVFFSKIVLIRGLS